MPPRSCPPFIALVRRRPAPSPARRRSSRSWSPASRARLRSSPRCPAGARAGPENAPPRSNPHPDLDVVGQLGAEFGEHAARVGDRARAVRRRLVPDRRQPEYRPGVTGAERRRRGCAPSPCSRPPACARPAGPCSRGDRCVRIAQQPFLERRVAPGARHDPGAVMRPNLVLVRLDQLVEGGRVDQPLLDQKRLSSARHAAPPRRAAPAGHGRGAEGVRSRQLSQPADVATTCRRCRAGSRPRISRPGLAS